MTLKRWFRPEANLLEVVDKFPPPKRKWSLGCSPREGKWIHVYSGNSYCHSWFCRMESVSRLTILAWSGIRRRCRRISFEIISNILDVKYVEWILRFDTCAHDRSRPTMKPVRWVNGSCSRRTMQSSMADSWRRVPSEQWGRPWKTRLMCSGQRVTINGAGGKMVRIGVKKTLFDTWGLCIGK
jgi:hypothetical protein